MQTFEFASYFLTLLYKSFKRNFSLHLARYIVRALFEDTLDFVYPKFVLMEDYQFWRPSFSLLLPIEPGNPDCVKPKIDDAKNA